VRDYQKRCISAGKNFQASGASGPFLVTADEIPDPSKLTLSTTLNGQRVQHSGLDKLIHSIPKTIAYLSTIIQLRPGDVLATGTPAGVGHARQPPLWLKPGDRITVEIPLVGTLSNPIVAGA
jgi:2-keto-4-pentenoate hydratase/2-oxohepta-3-ene-1,7-dioic acid hydratase in catechol pathway